MNFMEMMNSLRAAADKRTRYVGITLTAQEYDPILAEYDALQAEIERLTRERDKLRAALQRIVDEAESDDGLSAWNGRDIAFEALEQSAATNPDEGLPTADDVRGILNEYFVSDVSSSTPYRDAVDDVNGIKRRKT